MHRLSAFVLVMAAVSPALAQQGPEEKPASVDDPQALAKLGKHETWSLRFEPSLWYVSPSGNFKLPGQPEVGGGFGGDNLYMTDINQDSPRLSPFPELTLRSEDWQFAVSGFWYNAEERGRIADFTGTVGPHPVSPGDPLESSFDFASAQVQAGYRLPWALGNPRADFRGYIDVVGGLQFISLDLEVAAPSGSVKVDELWAVPFIGSKLSFDLTPRVSIDLHTTFGYFSDGGDKSAFTFDIFPGFMYTPHDNLGVQLGYRQILFNLEGGEQSDNFEWFGAMAGIYGGVVVRF